MLNPEDNIENIYRDFANNYPLKINDAGWEEFEQKLYYAGQEPANAPQNTAMLYKRLINMYRFWVAAVVIVAAFTGIFLHVKHGNEQVTGRAHGVEIAKDSVSDNVAINNIHDSTANKVKPLAQSAPQSPGASVSSTTKATIDDKAAPQKLNVTGKRDELNKSRPDKISPVTTGATKKSIEINNGQQDDFVVQHEKKANIGIVTGDTGKLILNTTGGNIMPAEGNSSPNVLSQGHRDSAVYQQNSIPADSLSTIAGTLSEPDLPAKEEKIASEKKKTVIKIKTLPHKYFYLGLATGPDINTVKMQRIDCAGLSSGIIAGVQLSPKISIETGFYYEIKKYYSSGQYVNKQKLGYNDPDDVLQSVDADSKFFEVPVIVNVSFAAKKRHSFLFSSGLSSYFTSSEKYDLFYRRPTGAGRVEHRDSDGWNSSFFSTIPLGLAYQLRLSSHDMLRIEPYAKLPLYGIGKISLPVVSSGIYINLTHAFFK